MKATAMTHHTHTSNIVTPFISRHAAPSRTAIVVPCFNEADRLDRDAFVAFLKRSPNTEFVFVNDGSRDNTLSCLCALQSAMADRVRVLDMPQNVGKAEAVRQGLLVAAQSGATHVGYWDADLATPLDAIDDFSAILRRFSDTHVVFGARRMMLGHRIERTIGRRIVSRICAGLARQAVRLPIGDTQCGAKLIRNTPILRAAIAEPFTAGWLFDVELFARISKHMTDRQFAFYEHPLAEWSEVAGSKVTATDIAKSGVRMLHLIFEMRLGIAPRRAHQGKTSVAAQIVPSLPLIDVA